MTFPVDFTEGELHEVQFALADRRYETKRYLAGLGTTTDHDECCPKHKVKVAAMNEQRQALTERMTAVDAALERVGAAEKNAALLHQWTEGGP